MRILVLPAIVAAGVFGQSWNLEKLEGPAFPPVNVLAPMSINNRGALAGIMSFGVYDPATGRTTTAYRGFKRNADGVFVYPIIAPGDSKFNTTITGLNELGIMCGWTIVGYDGISGYPVIQGFLYDGERFAMQDMLPGGSTSVNAINNLNHYAGNFGPSIAANATAFLMKDGKLTTFSVPGAQATQVTGLAWDDTIIGGTFLNNKSLAFLRGPQGHFRTFSVAGATVTAPLAINNNVGLIVGYYRTPDRREHGFIYDYVHDTRPGSLIPVTTIDYPEAYNTRITSINADGVIVGTALVLGQDQRYKDIAFVGRQQ